MNDPQMQYKEMQILTAPPEKLLLMLYDAAILALERAIEEMKGQKQLDKINTQLLKAQEIVGELMATLDFEKGGEIATNLQSLYAYFLQKIMKGNVEKAPEPIQEVLNFMKELRSGWESAIKSQSLNKENSSKKNDKKTPSSGINFSG